MAVTADYEAQSAVERELVLRLASPLWRLRRATAIESGLFKIQPQHLLQFRQLRAVHQTRRDVNSIYRNVAASENDVGQNEDEPIDTRSRSTQGPTDQSDDLTRSFVRLWNLPTCPLDRLSQYEATLWRQVCQILFTLQCLDRRKHGKDCDCAELTSVTKWGPCRTSILLKTAPPNVALSARLAK